MEDEHMDSLENFCERFDALAQQTEPLQHQAPSLKAQARTSERRRRWHVRAVLLPAATLLGVLGIVLSSVTPAHADGIMCGEVLGPGGRFELEDNLVECVGRAVTVQDGAILDLQGHIVACRGGTAIGCIVLTGTGAQLLNGAVEGGFHESIVLEGTGGHTVRNVTSTRVDANINVRSDHNQLINVMAESTMSPAFFIAGNKNLLTGNIARCDTLAFRSCIEVGGDQNRLIDNFATSTTVSARLGGFSITGNANVLRRNRAIGNEGPGIVVTGTANTLTRNTALRNALDLQDTNGDCADNTWRENTFRTSDPACIE
jgi:parallel beta-helix repeat protein